ncbi:MAG: PKD domain-containing protein [Thermoanaerobaculaceae bacterium]|nr:PKD domain-containing protein [Thermoanaerobaculaceae bacterium]
MPTRAWWRGFGRVTLAALVVGLGLAAGTGRGAGQASPQPARALPLAGAGAPDRSLDEPGLFPFFTPSAHYVPGVGLTVGLRVTQFPLGRTIRVEDRFPVGWGVSGISDSGTLVSGKVVWELPLAAGETAELTYVATPPAGTTGSQTFHVVAIFESDSGLTPFSDDRLVQRAGSECTLGCGATASTGSGAAPLAVQFTGSDNPVGCAGAVAYDWDFDDGTQHSTLKSPTHTYTTPGTFTWKMTASIEGVPCVKSGVVVVSTCSLSCSASATPSSGGAPLQVQFQGGATTSSCGGSVVYNWDFGDGSAHSAQPSPTHTYATAGTFTWKLIVTTGGQSCTKSGTVTVLECSLTCGATATKVAGRPPLGVSFTGTADRGTCSGTLTMDWDFGDGMPHASSASVSHTYTAAGTYTWKLTASVGGVVCQKTGRVMVSNADSVSEAWPRLFMIPDAAHTAGALGTNWVSDVVLHNPGSKAVTATLYFLDKDVDNTGALGWKVSVPAWQSLKLPDVVEDTFARSSSSGAILIGADGELVVTSRTYNDATTGTYGQYIEGYSTGRAIRTGETARLIQLSRNADYRTNIGFASVLGVNLDVKLDLYRANGSLLGGRTVTLRPYGYTQLNDVLAAYGSALDDAFAVVQSAQAGAAYLAYASVIDNRTGDPVQVIPVGRGLQASPAVPGTAQSEPLPGVVREDDDGTEAGEDTMAATAVKLQAAGANNLGQLGFADKPRIRAVPAQIPGLQNVAQVSSGGSHTILRKTDSTIWEFGANNAAQLGDSTLTHHSSPVRLAVLSDVGFVDAGSDHSMAVLRTDGSVWEWGFGVDAPRQVAGLNAVTQALGRNHRVVLRSNNTVWVWGNNAYGQLGIGNTTAQSAPVLVLGVNSIRQVAIGNWHTMALTLDGRVYCWGFNGDGEVGDGTTQNRNVPVLVSGLPPIAAIAAGGWASYALGADGKVYAWGWNEYGQLGDGTTTPRAKPVQVSGLSSIVEVVAGDQHGLARRSDGSVWAWGDGDSGQIGDGSTVLRLTPVKVSGVSGATGIAAGSRSSFAIQTGGTVMAWGYDEYGQLGLGRTVYSSTLVDVAGVGDVVAVSAGGAHSLALRNDGVILSWGVNNLGQLGYDSGGLVKEQPTVVPGVQNAVAVATGYAFSLALTSGGEVWSWGDNFYGQLGEGTEETRVAPARITGLPKISGIAAGAYHALAVTPGGKVWAWGYNGSGQVGNGSTTTQRVPVELTGITGVTTVVGGTFHSLALTSDRSLWVWGSDYYYQLGDGARTDRPVPHKLTSIGDVTQVAGGTLHTLAVKADKTLWSWGYNRSGQLGLGTGVSYASVPARVVGIGPVEGVVAGSEHSVALQGAAGVSTWGRNWLGQLADGTTTNRSVPNSLYYLNQVFAAGAGSEHTLLVSGSAICWLGCTATAAPSSGSSPLAVRFSATAQVLSCSESATYEWDFGDRSTPSTQQNPTHTYTTSGVYTWRLTVRAGASTCSRSGEIVVGGSGCATPPAPSLRGPAEASASADFTVGWSSTSPDGTYELQEASSSSFSDPQTFPVSASSRSFWHTEVEATTTLFYRVRAVDRCNNQDLKSDWSSTVQVTVRPPVGQTLFVPGAAHSTGTANTNWRTDLEVHNPTASAATFRIELLKRDTDNTSPQSVSRTLAAGQSERFPDVLESIFGFSGAATLRIVPTVGRVMATSRTYNDQPSGTFGQFIPAAGTVETVPFAQPARLVGLAQSPGTDQGFRTNIGFVNTTSRTLSLECLLLRGDGSTAGAQSWQLKPYEFKQIDRIYTKVTSAEVTDGYAVLSTSTLGGGFLAYASVIDNRSGDPVYVPARVVAQGTSGREELSLKLPGSVPMVLVRVPSGSFMMGSPTTDPAREEPETPQHNVLLSREVFVGKYEVTQSQWQAVMGTLPNQDCGAGSTHPVCQVSWQAVAGPGGFLDRLNAHLQATGQLGAGSLRLPTEAEWEYAARAGTTTRFSFGDALDCTHECGACGTSTGYMWWCGNNAPDGAKPVAFKRPNGFGLYDMHGNLWEWVSDWFGAYSAPSQTDPRGPATGTNRVVRSGRWLSEARNCRSAKRLSEAPGSALTYVGFRVAGSL